MSRKFTAPTPPPPGEWSNVSEKLEKIVTVDFGKHPTRKVGTRCRAVWTQSLETITLLVSEISYRLLDPPPSLQGLETQGKAEYHDRGTAEYHDINRKKSQWMKLMKK